MSAVKGEGIAGRRVLVTGGAGFIGSRLCARLSFLGADVYATSRSSRGADDAVQWLPGDVVDQDDVEHAFDVARPEFVFHLAGRVAGDRNLDLVRPMLEDNLVGAVNVLVAAQKRGQPRVVLAGSMEEPVHSPYASPSSPYAVAKWAATGYARLFHALFALPVVVLRIFMVYGPGQRDQSKLVPYVIESLLRGEAPRLTSGTRAIDWVYVDDVVDAFLAAAEVENVEGQLLDIGSGTTVTIRDLVRRLAETMHSSVEPIFGELPDRLLETGEVADVKRTKEALGWTPTTALASGLRQTVDWFAERADVEHGGSSA